MTPRWLWWLVASVIALEIPYPLVHGHARNVLTVVTVVVFAVASLAHAWISSGRRQAAQLLVVALLGFGAEVVGVHTGVPFGDYHYTGGLGPTVATVPLAVGLAWMMMAHPAGCVAARLTGGRARLLVAALALASWDVFLDPQMVDAHHWTWHHPDPHLPGIIHVPLSNFAGWLLVSMLVMAVLLSTPRALPGRDDRPALTLWVWTWLSSTFANLAFFHRPAVAAWGFVAMGLVGLPLIRSASR